MSVKRKQYNPQEKVSILRRHFIDKIPVSDLCTVFYRWQKMFFDNGAVACLRGAPRCRQAFQSQQSSHQKRQEKKIATLEAKFSQFYLGAGSDPALSGWL